MSDEPQPSDTSPPREYPAEHTAIRQARNLGVSSAGIIITRVKKP